MGRPKKDDDRIDAIGDGVDAFLLVLVVLGLGAFVIFVAVNL